MIRVIKKYILVFIFCLLFGFCDNVYAIEIGQKLEEDHYVSNVNSLAISIRGKESSINHFLSSKWRTYVKLDDLCSDEYNICSIVENQDDKIVLTRTYENMSNVYYQTTYNFKDNMYNSYLITSNSTSFSFDETAVSPDVRPLKIDNELYVPIRFITEALGAEVIYENNESQSKPKVRIDFYSNMNLGFDVTFYENSSKVIEDYSKFKKYNFNELKSGSCYDVVVTINNKTLYNAKLFSDSNNFSVNYNNNVKTNICLNQLGDMKFVFNYNNVPLLYAMSEDGANEDNTSNELDTLYLFGNIDGMSKENAVNLTATYEGKSLNFEKYATLKWQGHSSVNYDKKNYTIKLFDDEGHNEKYKFVNNGWERRNKYCLKANFIDFTQSRNLVSAKLWGEVVNSRDKLNPNLKGLVNGGAVDGYPIKLYINNEYKGLYTMNTCKDEYLFSAVKKPLIVYSQSHFLEDIWFSNEENHSNQGITYLEQWDVEYIKDEETENDMNQSLQRMVSFIYNSSDEEFRNSLSNYLDVDAMIDYMIFMYYVHGSDNYGSNVLWVTYDGNVWIPSAYDMDATFGLDAMGVKFFEYNAMTPYIMDRIYANASNILWDRIINLYKAEVKSRYFELRKSILTKENVIKKFNKIIKNIPNELYDEEIKLWYNSAINKISNYDKMITWQNKNNNLSLIENNYNFIIDYIENREKLLDDVMNKL